MEAFIVTVYFGLLFLLFIGLMYAFVRGTYLAFRRNWLVALLAMVFAFPVYIIWIGIELVIEEAPADDL